MKQKLFGFTAIIVAVFLLFIPSNFASANSQSVSVEIKDASGSGTSIADGYFSSSAQVVTQDGKNYLDLTMTSGFDYMQSLGGATKISDNGSSRVYRINIGEISKPSMSIPLSMHIVVPEEVAGMPYDKNHKANAVINTSNLSTGSAAPAKSEDNDTAAPAGNDDKVENPKTGDSTPIAVYSTLIIVALGVLLIANRVRATSN